MKTHARKNSATHHSMGPLEEATAIWSKEVLHLTLFVGRSSAQASALGQSAGGERIKALLGTNPRTLFAGTFTKQLDLPAFLHFFRWARAVALASS